MGVLATPGYATQQEAYDALIRQGASPELANILAAITRPESSGMTAANNGTYLGLWQIGNYHGFNNQLLLSDNIDYQAAAALSIYRQQGLGAWETYTNGSYLKYLGPNQADASWFGTSSPALPPQADMKNFSDIPTWQQQQMQLAAQAAQPQAKPLMGGAILDSPGTDNGVPNVLDSPSGETPNGALNTLDSPQAFDAPQQNTAATDPLAATVQQPAPAAGALAAAGVSGG